MGKICTEYGFTLRYKIHREKNKSVEGTY